jgi:hypothetical protein
MKLDLGWKTLDDSEAKWLYGFASLIDYDPASSDVHDSVGDHYDILLSNDGEYLFRFRVRGQRSFGSPAFTSTEGLFPIPADVARLLMDRDRSPVTTPNAKAVSFESIVGELYDWIDQLTPRIQGKSEVASDFIHDLKELTGCLNSQVYRACLAMSGVILERAIKQKLDNLKIPYAKDWMVGKLIGEISNSGAYVDPSLKSIWNIINAQRIIGVHAVDAAPIPSRDQALMVIFAVKDIVNRTFPVEPSDPPNGGFATPLGNSALPGGTPSVS